MDSQMRFIQIGNEEQMAIQTIANLFGEFCYLINTSEDRSDHYIEEMAKEGVTLKEVIRKVDLWMKKEKNQYARRAKEQK